MPNHQQFARNFAHTQALGAYGVYSIAHFINIWQGTCLWLFKAVAYKARRLNHDVQRVVDLMGHALRYPTKTAPACGLGQPCRLLPCACALCGLVAFCQNTIHAHGF